MGAAAPGGACQRDAAATVALVGSQLSPACPSPGCEPSPGSRSRAAWEDLCPEQGALQGTLSSANPSLSLQYHGNVTLESFSVLLAQVLGHSLGMSSDSPRGCSCPRRVCIMSPEAL